MSNAIARLLTLFLMGVLLVIGCSRPIQNPPSTPMLIGVALAQTSNLALLGQESVAGARIAEQYFRDRGGINGTPVKLVFQDAGGDEAGAINAFQTLITKHKVVGIVGPSSSQQAFSADPIADRAQVPVIGPTNTAKGVPEIGAFIARVASPVTVLAPNSLTAALKLNPNIKRVAVFYAQNDAFSQSETEIFQQAIAARGLTIVTVQKFQTTDTDFQTQATAAINLKPDLVVISSLASDGANLVSQLRELGYRKLIVSGNGLNTPNIFPVCKVRCDGVLIAQAYSPEHANDINKSFRAAYVKQYQKDPPQFSAQGFTAVQVFVEALKALNPQQKLQTRSLPELRSALNRQILSGQYDTPLGELSFTPDGEVIQKQFYVAQIKMDSDGKNGRFALLK
ncbi:MAG: ABC transporter substrate-binding protein [Leptolyngbyaceae cyanobacterium RU_5_1]|nr:ABC transporter substrate-binding protein [Leptolyngbyaceae cyanobacterium RU_5_1]